jgi:alpha,alpha-trehalose phosphorylase
MREHGSTLKFAPHLPEGVTRLSFNVEFRGRRLHVETTPTTTRYGLKQGDDLEIVHFDHVFTVSASAETVFEVTDDSTRGSPTPPRQPVGREPAHRVATAQRRATS